MKYDIYVFEEKKTASFLKKAMAEYEKRLSRYCKITCRFIRKQNEWEKILKNNEIVFQQHKELLDKHFKKWSLNKNENLFYILSGYAHASMKAITGKKNGGEKNEQQ